MPPVPGTSPYTAVPAPHLHQSVYLALQGGRLLLQQRPLLLQGRNLELRARLRRHSVALELRGRGQGGQLTEAFNPSTQAMRAACCWRSSLGTSRTTTRLAVCHGQSDSWGDAAPQVLISLSILFPLISLKSKTRPHLVGAGDSQQPLQLPHPRLLQSNALLQGLGLCSTKSSGRCMLVDAGTRACCRDVRAAMPFFICLTQLFSKVLPSALGTCI